mmetsp:Transcript_9668/g.14213  ORF Transcript_9668/g.14213 Transcript_9668/m.14213 type:complete len:102 (-) Transcript_9668:12-317(-)
MNYVLGIQGTSYCGFYNNLYFYIGIYINLIDTQLLLACHEKMQMFPAPVGYHTIHKEVLALEVMLEETLLIDLDFVEMKSHHWQNKMWILGRVCKHILSMQ